MSEALILSVTMPPILIGFLLAFVFYSRAKKFAVFNKAKAKGAALLWVLDYPNSYFELYVPDGTGIAQSENFRSTWRGLNEVEPFYWNGIPIYLVSPKKDYALDIKDITTLEKLIQLSKGRPEEVIYKIQKHKLGIDACDTIKEFVLELVTASSTNKDGITLRELKNILNNLKENKKLDKEIINTYLEAITLLQENGLSDQATVKDIDDTRRRLVDELHSLDNIDKDRITEEFVINLKRAIDNYHTPWDAHALEALTTTAISAGKSESNIADMAKIAFFGKLAKIMTRNGIIAMLIIALVLITFSIFDDQIISGIQSASSSVEGLFNKP